MSHWSYDLLKNVAINDKKSQDNLEYFKSLFRNEIGSARNMSRIRTMEELIDCLERHDAISECNIEPLREIADQCGGELEEAVTSYAVPKEVTTAEPQNEYRDIRLAEELQSQMNISGGTGQRYGDGLRENGLRFDNLQPQHQQQQQYQMPATPTPPPASQPVFSQELSDKKRAAIYKLVAREIGIYWRSLGRELEISQGIMDAIEIEYPRDLQSRVHKLFQAFEEDESIDPKKHLLLICRALDESRRKDLRRKIEEIMSH